MVERKNQEEARQEPREKEGRVMPQNELDYNLMTTDSVWGKDDVPEQLKEKLKKYYVSRGEDGGETVTHEDLWGQLGYMTRDLRLANLNQFFNEITYCEEHLNLAGEMLSNDMVEPFLILMQRVASKLELSQSKGGFLRRKMNTFTQERINKEEVPKKNLFGMSKKQEGYYDS